MKIAAVVVTFLETIYVVKVNARGARLRHHKLNLHTGQNASSGPSQGIFDFNHRLTAAYQGYLAPVAPNRLDNPGQKMPYGPESQNKGNCHPRCKWTCGNNACDEVCDPVCAPPQCETACAPIDLVSCIQRCEPPKCAVVCPTLHCESSECPRCKTICAPPKCHTECSERCESKCSDPQCSWNCKPGKCEKPACFLKCDDAKICNFDSDLNARPPPFQDGMHVVSKSLAGLDPSALGAVAAVPAPSAAVAGSPVLSSYTTPQPVQPAFQAAAAPAR